MITVRFQLITVKYNCLLESQQNSLLIKVRLGLGRNIRIASNFGGLLSRTCEIHFLLENSLFS